MIKLIFVYIILIIITVYILLAWKLVPTGYVGIIERLGRYSKTLNKGIHLTIPVVDQMFDVIKITPQEDIIDILNLATKDNKNISLKITIEYIINDPIKYVYNAKKSLDILIKLIEYILQNEIVKIDLQDFGETVEDINKLVLESVNKDSVEIGITIIHFMLKKEI